MLVQVIWLHELFTKHTSIAIFDTCPFIDVCWLVAVHVLALAEEERMAHTVELGYQAHIII